MIIGLKIGGLVEFSVDIRPVVVDELDAGNRGDKLHAFYLSSSACMFTPQLFLS
jgi:hypothetical protein